MSFRPAAPDGGDLEAEAHALEIAAHVPHLSEVGQRCGTPKACCGGLVPNLPSLPNVKRGRCVCVRASAGGRVHTRAHAPVRAGRNEAGKVGKVRNTPIWCGLAGSPPIPHLPDLLRSEADIVVSQNRLRRHTGRRTRLILDGRLVPVPDHAVAFFNTGAAQLAQSNAEPGLQIACKF